MRKDKWERRNVGFCKKYEQQHIEFGKRPPSDHLFGACEPNPCDYSNIGKKSSSSTSLSSSQHENKSNFSPVHCLTCRYWYLNNNIKKCSYHWSPISPRHRSHNSFCSPRSRSSSSRSWSLQPSAVSGDLHHHHSEERSYSQENPPHSGGGALIITRRAMPLEWTVQYLQYSCRFRRITGLIQLHIKTILEEKRKKWQAWNYVKDLHQH